MSLNYQKDPAAQVPTLTTGLNGVDSVVQFYQNGTNEIKNLLKNECSIIYECSYCRSLFRSIVNFVAHKRTICRSLQHSVRLELDYIKKNNDQEKSNQSITTKTRRNPNSLRRVNIASLLGKHIENFSIELEGVNDSIEIQTLPKISRITPSTTFKKGHQVLNDVPTNLQIKERVPEDRTVLVMPQENSTRYREMQLRTRRNVNDSKNVIFREFCQQDINILQRIPPILLELVEFQDLKCIHENCGNVQSFVSVSVLSHHIAICHQKQFAQLLSQNGMFHCFICGNKFQTEKILQDHFNQIHSKDRLAHINQRLSLVKTDNSTRLAQSTSRRSLSRKRSSSPDEEKLRFRSISPSESSSRSSAASSAHGTETSDLGSSAADTSRRSSVSPNAATQQSQLLSNQKTHNRFKNSSISLKKRNNSFLITQIQKHAFKLKENKEDKKITNKESKVELNCRKRVRLPTKIEQENKKFNAKKLLTKASNEKNEIKPIDNNLSLTLSQSNIITLSEKTPELNQDVDNKGKFNQLLSEHGVRRQQRNRKPTKRFYNEEYVVDPTKHETRRLIDQTKENLNNFSESNNQVEKTVQSNTALLNVECFDSNKFKLSRKTKKQQKPKTKKKLIDQTLSAAINTNNLKKNVVTDFIENLNDLKNRNEVIDQVLKKTDKKVLLDEMSLLASLDINTTLTPQKSLSEPPASLPSKKKENSENAKSDSMIYILNDTNDVNKCNVSFSKDCELQSQTNKNDSFLLPSTKNQLPSILAEKYREKLAFYTPRARKARIDDEERKEASAGSSRRKQNLMALKSGDLSDSIEKTPPPRPSDLTKVPVYLTEKQRDIFFAPLRPLFSGPATDGLYQCSECSEVLRCIRDGRRHMVSHLRVMRIRCSLCDAGAFFCSDMRIHLMFRHCEKLYLAPEEFVTPGDVVPCMDKKKADLLSKLVDPFHPGRVMYTSGKIVSWANPKAYYPDPKIEERILGKARPRRAISIASSPSASSSSTLYNDEVADSDFNNLSKINKNYFINSSNQSQLNMQNKIVMVKPVVSQTTFSIDNTLCNSSSKIASTTTRENINQHISTFTKNIPTCFMQENNKDVKNFGFEDKTNIQKNNQFQNETQNSLETINTTFSVSYIKSPQILSTVEKIELSERNAEILTTNLNNSSSLSCL